MFSNQLDCTFLDTVQHSLQDHLIFVRAGHGIFGNAKLSEHGNVWMREAFSFVLVSCFNMVPDGPCQSLNLLGRSPCNPKGTQGTEFFFVKRNVYGKIQNGRFRLDHFTFVAALDESKLQPFQAFRQAVKPSVGRGSLYFIRYLRQPAGFDVVHKLK